MSHTSPSPGPPSDGPGSGIMASLRRRSEHLATPDVDQEQSSEQASDLGANGTGPSKPVRKLTGILTRSSTPGKERKDSRHSLDVPQISIRPSTDQSLAQRIINNRPDTPPDSNPRPSTDTSGRLPIDAARKRGVAFLTRLGVRAGRKKDGDGDGDDDDGASHISEYRSEGANAAVMPASNAAGFIPHHKEPPKYIRVRPYNTKHVEFGHMFLAQELSRSKPMASTAPITTAGKRVMHSDDSIWAVEFSKDGRFLAAAGQDMVVRVYAMLTTPDERRTYEDEMQGSPDGERLLRAPVFRTKPLREYHGHTGSIHDLAWSKNNFLLSASSDKTVRLWYPFLPDCIHVFGHKDSVMSISFHPTDDRFFLAGAQDSVLRLWSIPDKEVAFQTQEADIITAVAFAPDGKTCMAGLMNGDCMFYETNGLARQSQVQVRSSRGKNSKGSKITSIQAMAIPPNKPGAEVKVLISSNDSRIRVYNLSDKSLDMKLKGHENSCSNVKARFSDDGAYIITGSEDRRTFIWTTSPSATESKDKRPCESFVAHSGAVTAAMMAPKVSRLLLSASGDPVYDLCNPPPVTLMSLAEAMASHSVLSDEPPETPNRARRMEESPAYLARCAHLDGNIIVTSDRTGQIRVFRQDCASVKRRNDPWELGSASRLVLSSRAASIATRNSGGSRLPSRRNSLVGANAPSITLTPQHSTERINIWRQDVVEHGGRMRPVSLPPSIVSTSIRSVRSSSPSKADASREPAVSVSTLASDARRQPYAGMSSPVTGRFTQGSPASSINTDRTSTERANALRATTLALTGYPPDSAVSTPVVGLGLDEPMAPPRISVSSRPIEPNDETGTGEAVADSDDKTGGGGNGDAAGNGSGNGGLFSFWTGLPKWRNISGLRILTPASSPAMGGLSPRGSADASPTKSDPNSPAIGTGRVSISTPLVCVSSHTSSEPNEEPASQRR